MRALDGFGLAVVSGDLVVAPGEGERAVAERALEHGDRLLQAGHTRRLWVEPETDGVIFRLVPAGADGDLQPPAAQHVE